MIRYIWFWFQVLVLMPSCMIVLILWDFRNFTRFKNNLKEIDWKQEIKEYNLSDRWRA